MGSNKSKDARIPGFSPKSMTNQNETFSLTGTSKKDSTRSNKIPSSHRKLVLSLNESRKVCDQMVYTKKAQIVVLRRYSSAPTMTCFSDFMFLYTGNHEEMSESRFETLPDSLTFTQTLQDFNWSLIQNRFNFLMYNTRVYKNLLFNGKVRPEIFGEVLLLIRYIENLIRSQGENYHYISINPFFEEAEASQGRGNGRARDLLDGPRGADAGDLPKQREHELLGLPVCAQFEPRAGPVQDPGDGQGEPNASRSVPPPAENDAQIPPELVISIRYKSLFPYFHFNFIYWPTF